MKTKLLAAAAALAMTFGAAGAADATIRVFDFSAYETGFQGILGAILVDDHNLVGSVDIDVLLRPGVVFQLQGQPNPVAGPADALIWDLGGGNTVIGGLDTTFSLPTGGNYPTGGSFAEAVFSNNAFRGGNGFLSGFDYSIKVQDNQGSTDFYGSPDHLAFTLFGTGLNTLSFTSQSEDVNGVLRNIYFGSDLRQTLATGAVVTGYAGATLTGRVTQQEFPGVPEPATWAMMIVGFFGMGSLLRRRRLIAA